MTTVIDISPLPPGVSLTLPAMPENVALARQAVAGLTEALDVDPMLAADIKIAVTEACTNAVVHAYPGREGTIEITVTTLPGHMVISVRDRGLGFRPSGPFEAAANPDAPPGTVGFGLALISSLADDFAIMSGSSGTEVQMLFALGEQRSLEAPRIFNRTSQLSSGSREPPPGVVLSIGTHEPVAAVLGRLVSLLAARAGFSIDRLSDAQLISDAVAGHAPSRSLEPMVSVTIREHPGGFDLSVGPLASYGARALIADSALPGVGPLLERLADEVIFEADAGAGAEILRLRVAKPES
jgi:anti-sigma regulatory factor (Ser/Thr protein kinase)